MSNAKSRGNSHESSEPAKGSPRDTDRPGEGMARGESGPGGLQGAPESAQGTPAAAGDTAGAAAWEKRIEEAQAEAERYRDQLLRKAAEFENYKRRTELDWQNTQRLASEKVLLAFLPILDDFLRSLKSGAEQKSFDAFYQGVELIYHKMLKTFKAQGVEPMDAAGKPFNVDEHDALLQIPRTDVPPHTVIEEIEKGYRLGDRVLRHAKVVVSAESPAPGSDNQGKKHDAA